MIRLSVPFLVLILACICPIAAFGQDEHQHETAESEELDVDVKVYDVNAPDIDQPLKIVEFEAVSIGRLTKYMVLLPEDYETSEKRYPVLYLLHGLLQNYTVWPAMGVPEYVKKYDLIVVMPDAGNSWYINWSQSAEGEYNNWEDFIVYDVIHSVDQVFRTVPSREGRAINGLSMGGYGAITIGLRHPTMFSSIGSHSGALAYARNARVNLETGKTPAPNVIPPPMNDDRDAGVSDLVRIPGFTMQHERYPNGTAFTTVEECNAYDPFFLITKIPARMLPHIYLDCGLDDSLLGVSQEFATQLLANNIPFTYGQSPGEHRPSYWSREVAQSLAVQYAILQRNVRVWEYRQEVAAAEAAAAAEAEDQPGGEKPQAPSNGP
ncbi:MAG: hypothetical protein IID09_09035 [Candidatus Hydrogenedentes bacterium]|nr:hypothetical protein [Candidatus Hydrogenedentota bacterium]